MISNNLLVKVREYIREGKLKSLLCGFIYFVLYMKDTYLGNLRYTLAKIRSKGMNYTKIIIVNANLMCINLKDSGICKDLYLYRKREHFSTDFVKNILKENEIVIDIGANIGYYALLEARLANKGKIYCIEPIPTNINLLKRSIELNNFKNISVFQYAMGDKNGNSKMYIYDKCNWCSFTKNLDGNIIEEIEVPIITLDTFVESYVCQYPTFIRMDVEGYEYQIIKGAFKILEINKPLKICIELHPHLMSRENMIELLNILKQRDFKVKAIFIDASPHAYKNINTINRLRKVMGLQEFGFAGKSYEDLDRLLREKRGLLVFFEREKSDIEI